MYGKFIIYLNQLPIKELMLNNLKLFKNQKKNY